VSEYNYDYQYADIHEEEQMEQRKKNWGHFFKAHAMYPANKDAKFLEIGCAYGVLLQHLIDEGYKNLKGVELDETLVSKTKKKGLDVTQGDAVEFLTKTDEKFDAIYFFDVLEHIAKDKQLEFLRKAKECLAPTGFIAFSVPNALTPISGHFRYSDWTHTCAFTEQSVNFVLKNSGFSNPAVRASHFEHKKILKLKKNWHELCKREFGMENAILTPNLFVVAYADNTLQEKYNKETPSIINDYETCKVIKPKIPLKIQLACLFISDREKRHELRAKYAEKI